ncbi:hypothetical protein WUBG_15297, partial [Wuchereria bancrofti]
EKYLEKKFILWNPSHRKFVVQMKQKMLSYNRQLHEQTAQFNGMICLKSICIEFVISYLFSSSYDRFPHKQELMHKAQAKRWLPTKLQSNIIIVNSSHLNFIFKLLDNMFQFLECIYVFLK